MNDQDTSGKADAILDEAAKPSSGTAPATSVAPKEPAPTAPSAPAMPADQDAEGARTPRPYGKHTAQKVQNILFAAFVCISLFSAFAGRAYLESTAEPGETPFSWLEKRDYATASSVLEKSFADGKAQKEFEQFMADSAPFRDNVLLTNAALQRLSIKTGARLMGYDVYPTFFESTSHVVEGRRLLLAKPQSVPRKEAKEIAAFAKTFNDAAAKHPDINFCCRFVLETRHTEVNPMFNLTSNTKIDSNWVQRTLVDKLDPKLNAAVDPISSLDEIEDQWLATDPHWTLKRALVTYDSIASQLGLRPSPDGKYITVVPAFNGSVARVGLYMDYSSNLQDMPTDFSKLHYYKIENDKKAKEERSDPGKRAKTLAKNSHLMKQNDPSQGYSTYFGAFNGLIVNKGENNGKTCLLIGDSFTHCLKRYFAANYAKTYSILPGNYTTKLSLEEMIEKYKPDDVIMLTQAMKYRSYVVKSPQFIGLNADEAKSSEVEDVEL